MYSTIISRQSGSDSNYKTWHTNSANMLIYIHSGEGSIVCRDKIYPIKKGVLCFIGAKIWHYTMPTDAKTYARSKIFISSDLFDKIPLDKELTQRFHEESFVYAEIAEPECTMAESLIRDSMCFSEKKKYENLITMSCFIRLLILLNNNIIDAVSSPKSDMNKAIEFINSHIYGNLSINDICDHIHMSKYHFCRKFKKSTTLTVMDYILKTRIILAENMLAKEKLSVSEISERCGFSSISYFCRVFKKHTGQTPLQFRNCQNRK